MRKTQKEVVEKIPIFGNRLKILMLVKDINNQELADKMGVIRKTGRHFPQVEKLLKAAND